MQKLQIALDAMNMEPRSRIASVSFFISSTPERPSLVLVPVRVQMVGPSES